jgi:hypothetical protein
MDPVVITEMPVHGSHAMSIDEAIQQTQKTLKELQERKLRENDPESFRPEGQLAIRLHSKLCRSNHIDHCDWDYGITKGRHDWTSNYAHKEYLKKAQAILKSGVPLEYALKFVEQL